MHYIKFEESRPKAVREMIGIMPVAYVPVGALEWHGEHDPLGLDTLKAYALCEKAAELTGGVLFPAMHWGAFDTMPFPFTFNYNPRIIKSLIRQTIAQLAEWGFKVIVILSGHYPPSLIKFLIRESIRFNKHGPPFLIGAAEQIFATDIGYYGDHAGMWETSLMLALRPELVDLDEMPANLSAFERISKHGVMGQDPKSKSSAEKGRMAVEHIVNNIARVVEHTLRENNDAAIMEIYRRYNSALNIFSPRVFHLIKEGLDVHSLGELIKYGLWTFKKMP